MLGRPFALYAVSEFEAAAQESRKNAKRIHDLLKKKS